LCESRCVGVATDELAKALELPPAVLLRLEMKTDGEVGVRRQRFDGS
jgi:hypothetical protein